MPHESFPLSSPVARQEQDPNERKRRAELLCQKGDYTSILEAFAAPEQAGLLTEQIDRIKREGSAGPLREASDQLAEHDWEMLTILELFDRATFEHCVRTYTIAKEKIESTGPVGDYLREHITREGLTSWDIELACLLHDMGKISLAPKELLLNNALSGQEWQKLFEEFCHETYDGTVAHEKITTYKNTLSHNPRIREKDITPLHVGLTAAEQELVTARGFDPEQSLGAIIDSHQDASVEIARLYHDNPTLLSLIGNHHEQVLSPEDPLIVSQSTVRLSTLVNALRLADEFDAYHSKRSYKEAHPRLASLVFLTDEARRGFVDTALTKLWIQDDLENFDIPQYLEAITDPTQKEEETKASETLQTFLATQSPM